VGFAIWITRWADHTFTYHVYVGYIGSLAVLVWTFIVPPIYEGDPPAG
jgi:hypothetical protein